MVCFFTDVERESGSYNLDRSAVMKQLYSWVTHKIQVKIAIVVFFAVFVASFVNFRWVYEQLKAPC